MFRWSLMILLVVSCLAPLTSQAFNFKTDSGLKTTADTAQINDTSTNITVATGRVLAPVLSFVGILFFALMIYAGVLWMTAAGDDKKIDKARQIIIAAVIGLIIVALAYTITRFVGESINNNAQI
jgi:hypothetical protein